MKIVQPTAELVDAINAADLYSKLELCGRVCYQSSPKNAEQFIRMLIRRGHESVLEHVSLTFHIICDRAIMAELTRHRLASFSVESTRYCKYDELTIVAPPPDSDILGICWQEGHSKASEDNYHTLLERFGRPELARAVLPLCTKSELYMTANLREWRHILKLRTAKAAHPQMRQIANQILAIFRDKLPVIVEDIKNAD